MPEQQNTSQVNNKRIAKNTILLYFRTLFVLLISLYTSRVILNQLGVEDFGIYNVVGGVVSMFAVISSALSSAISRFITFELGRGEMSKLKTIFSTSVNIQIGIAIIVLIICEAIGVWFLNTKMTIPQERLYAANWVLQFSLLVFCINLISVPYNACIIAHEHMTAFAYISVLEAVLKLAICFMLAWSSFDKLIVYAFLMLSIAVIIRLAYGIYCHRNFEESRYEWIFDKSVLKEMMGFAGWNFFTNAAWIFNTQGVNLLTNVYFGVTLNAARGIAAQVDGATSQFVANFTTAINPQITKTYANRQLDEMHVLMCRGAKFSFMLLFIMALPVILEADFILSVWLKTVPDNAVLFTRLAVICSLVNLLNHPFYIGCLATGNIRKYVITVTLVGLLTFPLSWVCFAIGLPAQWSYISFIVVYVFVDLMCVLNAKWLLNFPISLFLKDVLVPICLVAIIGSIVPYIVCRIDFPSQIIKAIVTILISVLSASGASFIFGMNKNEREYAKRILIKHRG